MIRLATLLSVGLITAAAGSLQAADDAKAILEKAIKAHGGADPLKKLQAGTAKNKGKITLPMVGEVDFTQDTSHMMPDKFKEIMELNVAGQTVKIRTIINGDSVTIDANGQNVPVSDTIKENLANARFLMKATRLVPILEDKTIELSIYGDAKVEGKDTVGIKLTAPGKKDILMFFDKATHLLAKIEHRGIDPNTGKEVNEERFVLEYEKNKDGIPMPKKVLVKHDGNKFLEADVSAQLLEKIDESEFKP